MAIEHATLIEELARIDTPTLSNAVEQLQVRNQVSGFADLNLRCLAPESGVMCGTAVTAQAVTMAPEPGDREQAILQYVKICEELEALPGPGVVVIQEVVAQTSQIILNRFHDAFRAACRSRRVGDALEIV